MITDKMLISNRIQPKTAVSDLNAVVAFSPHEQGEGLDVYWNDDIFSADAAFAVAPF
jgi:hypothetical protein